MILYCFKFYILNCFNLFNDSTFHLTHLNDFNYLNCYFSRINNYNGNDDTLNGYGGIIFCYNVLSNMKINECIFYFCSAKTAGGAIFYSCSSYLSNSELNKNCINNCFTENGRSDQFASISVYNTINQKNFLNLISIINCNKITSGYITYELWNGNVSIINTNSSNNNNLERSGLMCVNPSLFLGIFCSFINNYVSTGICISLQGGPNFLFYSNIINNNSPSAGGVITHWSGESTFNDCIFLNNINTLFYAHSHGLLNIFNSKIYHNGYSIFSSGIGSISPINNSYLLTSTFSLSHFNSQLCLGIPLPTLMKTLNPTISKTLNPTISKTPKSTPTISQSYLPTLKTLLSKNNNNLFLIFILIINT